jgi:DNA-binding MarR family transcriptional regulator
LVTFLDTYLPYLLHRADNAISGAFHRSLVQQGVEVSEWRVLASLQSLGRSTMTDLARHSGLPQPTTSHTVSRLVERGLVAREGGVVDRRQRFVALTAAGEAEAARLVEEARGHERTQLGRLELGVPEQLRSVLRTVLAELEARNGPAEPDLS